MSEFGIERPRSWCPCQSMPTRGFSRSTIEEMKSMSAVTPSGVACPTLSQTQIREAPAWMAAP